MDDRKVLNLSKTEYEIIMAYRAGIIKEIVTGLNRVEANEDDEEVLEVDNYVNRSRRAYLDKRKLKE